MEHIKNYMTTSDNGTVHIDYKNIPSSAFLDTIQTKEICVINITKVNDTNRRDIGINDVKITNTSTNTTSYISRKELASKYRLINGKPIKFTFLHSGKNYIVCTRSDKKYKAFKLPNNCTTRVGNTMVPAGSYIIGMVDDGGNLITESLNIINPRLFRKSFKIPMQDAIENSLNGKRHNNFTLAKKYEDKKYGRTKVNNSISLGKPVDFSNISMQNINIPKQNMNIQNRPINTQPSVLKSISNNLDTSGYSKPAHNNIQQLNNYKYEAVGRIEDINKNTIGVAFRELRTGKIIEVPMNKAIQACESNVVNNLMAVHSNDGNVFLRGNGILFNNLPKVVR